MLIDTHCHLADAAFSDDVGEVLARAVAAGVGHVVAIGETPDRAEAALALARVYAGVSATAGLHPHDARHWSAATADRLAGLVREVEVVAVGETGLDYHYDHSPRDRQRAAFEAQLDLGRRVGKPVVVHAREADDDLAAMLREHPHVTAVLHSFSSGDTLLQAALDLGHYVGLSGMVTFRSWRLDDAVRRVPLDRLLVETDAPYLAPVPNRGKRNEPAWVTYTADRLAHVAGVDRERLRQITTDNARRLFGARVAPTAS